MVLETKLSNNRFGVFVVKFENKIEAFFINNKKHLFRNVQKKKHFSKEKKTIKKTMKKRAKA